MSQPTPTTNFKHRKEQHGSDHFKVHTGVISCAPGGTASGTASGSGTLAAYLLRYYDRFKVRHGPAA